MTVCLNSTRSYGVMPTAGSNYTWNIIAGTGGAGTINNGVAPNNLISVTWTSSGTCTLEASETNQNNCTEVVASITITVELLPVVALAGPSPVCLNSTGNVYTTDAGMTNYAWTVAGGTISAGGTTTSNTVTVTWDGTGPYSVSVNYNNPNGCTATTAKSFPVTINPLPAPVISGTDPTCGGNEGTYNTPAVAGNTYTWTVVGGTISSGLGTSQISVTWNPTLVITSGTVSVVETIGGSGCKATDTKTIVVNPKPTATDIWHD